MTILLTHRLGLSTLPYSPFFFSCSKLESRFMSPRFPYEGPFTIWMLHVCVSISISKLCNFPVTSLLSWGSFFSHIVRGYGSITFWSSCRLLWSHFGHDRAKNDPEIDFLVQAVNCLVGCMYAMVLE